MMSRSKKVAVAIGATVALGVPVLIGGKIVDKTKYPAIIRISAGGGCTAAVVGPNVVLTAAHCVDNGSKISFKHDGKSYSSEGCSHHPGYSSNQTKDFALCKVATVKAPYITINTDHNLVKVGDSIVLSGYGCTNKGGGGGNDGYLRMGEARVTRVPTSSNFDIVSTGAAALCFGDSGGPAFKGSLLVGVNSRGNIEDTSYVSAVHMADGDYMLGWAKSNSVEICGLNKDCIGNGPGPSPSPKPQPEPKPNPDPESLAWWEKLFLWIAQLIWDSFFGGK
jgi:hypothetical protein